MLSPWYRVSFRLLWARVDGGDAEWFTVTQRDYTYQLFLTFLGSIITCNVYEDENKLKHYFILSEEDVIRNKI